VSKLDGTKALRLRIARHAAAGRAHLRVTFTDAAGNVKVAKWTLRVPRLG
jgi:hypothetical protein